MNDYYLKCKFPKQALKKKKKVTVSKATYEKVFKACKGQCVLCGTSKSLELHHILGRGKDLTDNYKYCCMLCTTCHHQKVHGNLKFYRPILLEIARGLYGKKNTNNEKN